jgi:Aspartyl/Asparaginyl beta-hydroxylase
MRHFQQIAAGADVLPMLHAVQRHPELWNADRFRTTYPNTPHGEADDILLRFSDPDKCNTFSTVIGDDQLIWHYASTVLPWKPLVLDLMRRLDAYGLDRLMVTRLRPGRRILPHADNIGPYVKHPERSRYHVVLQGLPGSLYRTGDETVTMLSGQVWWFDPLTEHEVVNNSADDRIHMLVDLRLCP